jgi:hypothetical protein
MKTSKPLIVFFYVLLSQTCTAFAGGLLPTSYQITDNGLQITESFDKNLEVGDVITHAEGETLKPRLAAGIIRRLAKKNNELELTISRGGQIHEYKVSLISQADLKDMRETRKRMEAAKEKRDELKRWLATNQLKDSRGRIWSVDEITEHNDPIEVDIERTIRKHRDIAQDTNRSQSLGTEIEAGFNVITSLKSIAQAPEGQPVKLGRTVMETTPEGFPLYPKVVPVECPTLDDALGFLTDYHFKVVEKLFDFTDAENYLIWCRNGEVISAEDMWLKLAARSAGK